MFRKKEDKQEINILKLNEVINISSNILKIIYLLAVVVSIYIFIIIFKELNLKSTIITILSITSPLFIGMFIAWLFDPIVTKMQKKGLKRIFGTTLTYVLFIILIFLMIGTIIPLLTDQINDFVNNLPQIFNKMYEWIDEVFINLNTIEGFDALSVKENVLNQLSDLGANLTNSLPDMTFSIVKNLFSVIGKIVIGMIIGFYLLVSFDNVEETMLPLLPQNAKDDTIKLIKSVNTTCRNFVTGALLDCTLIFIVSSISFFIIGLKAPLLFGLFCGITNVIPYAGPYIGGAPAVIVGFSVSPTCGILTLAVIVIIQALEGNLLQPLIMSRTTKLHPVTIMLGLLIFGHFFGIFGMVISTPLIGTIKAILIFFNNKYEIIEFKKEELNGND